jgi:hypothetical protein
MTFSGRFEARDFWRFGRAAAENPLRSEIVHEELGGSGLALSTCWPA